MTRSELETALLAWVAGLNAGPGPVTADTLLLEEGLVTSLQVLDLLLLVEELTGTPVDVARLRPGAFASVRAIVAALAPEAAA